MSQDQVRSKVQRLLTDFVGNVQVSRDGDLGITYNSARVIVNFKEFQNDTTIVKVWSPMLREVKLTPDVYKWVATEGQYKFFAHAKVMEGEDGTGMIVWEHDLLGDYIDADELRFAVASVAIGADELDDELQARFGGRRGSD